MGQRPHSGSVFPHFFSFFHFSTVLNLSIQPPPSQLPRYHSTQSRLYPPPSIWLYCRLGMPGMSTGSPILSVHTQSTMQAHAWACTYGFSKARRVSSGRPGTDTRRRGQIGFNQTCHGTVSKALSARLSLWAGGAPEPNSNLRFPLCLLHQRPLLLCRVALRESCCLCEIFMPRQSWWKDRFLCCSAHLFLLRKCGSGPAEGQKQIQPVDAGKVCQDLSVRYPREREFEWMHTFRSTHTHINTNAHKHMYSCFACWKWWMMCMKFSYTSQTFTSPTSPLVGISGGPLTF